jgi:aminoglycoside phosphotransferase (APT) family kinase protein
VPRTYALCEDDSVIGTAFFIMEWVRGRVRLSVLYREVVRPDVKLPCRFARTPGPVHKPITVRSQQWTP